MGTTTASLSAGVGWTDIVNAYCALYPAYLAVDPNVPIEDVAGTIKQAPRLHGLSMQRHIGNPISFGSLFSAVSDCTRNESARI